MRIRNLDSTVHMGPFQLETFCASVYIHIHSKGLRKLSLDTYVIQTSSQNTQEGCYIFHSCVRSFTNLSEASKKQSKDRFKIGENQMDIGRCQPTYQEKQPDWT